MDSNVIGKQYFDDNLKRWSLFCPEAAKKISQLECRNTSFYHNPNGQLNLQKKEAQKRFMCIQMKIFKKKQRTV